MSEKRWYALVVGVMMIAVTGITMAQPDSFHRVGTTADEVPVYAQKVESSILSRTEMNVKPCFGTEAQSILYGSFGGDVQVTNLPENQNHPSIAIDVNSNPIVMFDNEIGPMNHVIFLQSSTGSGTSWPADQLYQLTTEEDGSAINPDLSFFSDGTHAVGTYWVETGDPIRHWIEFGDINDPATWTSWTSDASQYSEYVGGNAVAMYGDATFAIGTITDYVYGEYNVEETILINWVTDITTIEGGWTGGVFWNYEDSTMANLDATSGDGRLYFVCERHTVEKTQLFVAYAPATVQDYSEWRGAQISSNQGNFTNPQIAVSGDYHYIVTELTDMMGNKDIMCYTTKNPGSWNRNTVVNSPIEDEMYPIITADGKNAICTFIKKGNLYYTKTKDGGKTWSAPELVNDVDGTVVETYHSSSASGPYLVWTDSRNVNYDLYFDTVPAPVVKIMELSGGFGLKATVSNTGTAAAENLSWSIVLEGNLIFIGNETIGTIDTLAPGASQTIKSDFVLGVGSIVATIKVGDESMQAQGFLLGPLILGV